MRRTTGIKTKAVKGAAGGCSGCPRDPTLKCEDPPACTMCWCFAEVGAQIDSPKGTEVAWTCGRKEESPVDLVKGLKAIGSR
jgi:hypothetical protein